MNIGVVAFVQAIGALGSLILLSAAIVLLIVQYLKDVLNLEGEKKKRLIQLLALLVGIAWGAVALRLPALLIWPDINAYLGGSIIGALSGMAAIGGKSFTNGAIDRQAIAGARAKASVSDNGLPGWAAAFQHGLDSVQAQITAAAAEPQPAPLPVPGQDSPSAVTVLTVEPGPAPGDGGPDLTPVNVRPAYLLAQGAEPQISRTSVPFD